MPQLLVETDGTIRAANTAACRLFAAAPSEIEGSRLATWAAISADCAPLLRTLARSTGALPGALRIRAGDGESVDCRVEGGRVAADGEECVRIALRLMPRETAPSRFAVLTRQVRDLKQEIGRRRRAEMLLEHQKSLLERIVSNSPLPEVLEAIASFVEDHSDRARCSILLLSEDRRRLLFGAAPSLPAEYNAAIDGLEIGPTVGSCGTAAFHGEPVTVENISEDPLWTDFKDLAAEHGLAACWSQPVTGPGGRTLATLAMYYSEPGKPTVDDLYLTSIGVDLAAIAILGDQSRQQLRLRAEQLAQADRRKDRFLAMLSHELRNPLAPIVSTLEVLAARSDADDELRSHVSRLQRQTTHLNRLVDDLLDISRIAHGAIELKVDRIDLRACVEQAVDSSRDSFAAKEQSLVLDPAPDPLWVDGDEDRLRQVFVNLLNNASKYSEPGRRVWVDLEATGGNVEVRVRDEGHGLAADARDRLFEPFTQADRTAVESRGGLGLGLTLVKQLVECHGGAVYVASEGEGCGSEFTVTLPRAEAVPGRSDTITEPSEAPARPLKVMVVEDNTDSAYALRLLLELWGHSARTCHDGDSAVDAILDTQPDVVLLDIDLPGRDGYSVLRQLRQRGFGTKNRLMIALTGFGRLRDVEQSAATGFHHHLIKPADPGRLRRLLHDFAAAS